MALWFSPARVGDQHLGSGADLLEEVGADLQAAGAADGLHRGHAAGFDDVGLGAEHQALDCGIIGSDAVDGQVAAGRGLVHHRLLGGLHALEQGQLAVVVEVHAHAQIHLAGVGVGSELLVQTQDGVAGAISTAVNRDMKRPWDVLGGGKNAASPKLR